MAKKDAVDLFQQKVGELKEAEIRVELLKREVAELARDMRGASLSRSRTLDIPSQLLPILQIVERLGGEASLDDIHEHSEPTTKPGTLAQIKQLIKLGYLDKYSRGRYGFKKSR